MSPRRKQPPFLLSIIIPVFNEQNTLARILSQVQTFARKLKTPSGKTLGPQGFELVIVNDGSTDGTAKILKQFQSSSHFQIYNFAKNRGKGFAIRHGIKQSRGKFLLIQDADLEYHPRYYQTVLTPLFRNQAQVVYGSRLARLPLSLQTLRTIKMPAHFVANKLLSALTNLLYGSRLTDMETGYKAFDRQVANSLNLKSNGFEIEVELTAKILRAGFPITEVPITTEPRNYQEGKKITYLDGFQAVFDLFRYRLNRYSLAYLAIVALAAVTRFWNFSHRYGLWADQARDALVGRVALETLSPPLIGSFSSAGPFTFGPYWYYYSMLMAFLTNSHLGYWLGITFLSLLSVGMLSYIGFRLAGHRLGVLSGLLAAISQENISSALAATQHSAVAVTVTAALLFLVLYHHRPRARHAFFLAFCLSLSVNFHYLSLYLLPLLLVFVLVYRPAPSHLGSLAAGFALPFVPLLLFDLRHDWWNTRQIIDYLRFGQYRIYVPNRWLTYAGVFWPELWANLVGGFTSLGALLMSGSALLLTLRFLQRRLDKRLTVISLGFLGAVIWFRYFRGERFSGYVTFAHPFVLLFSAWFLSQIISARKIIGLALTILVLAGSYAYLISASTPGNIHPQITRLSGFLRSEYPGQKFALYDYGFHSVGCSYPLALFLDSAGVLSDTGIPIGTCFRSACPQSTYTLSAASVNGQVCQLVGFPALEPPASPPWTLLTPAAVFGDTVEWWRRPQNLR